MDDLQEQQNNQSQHLLQQQTVFQLSDARDNAKLVANELGIRSELLYKWRANLLTDGVRSFSGSGNKKQTPEEKEIALLKKQVRELQLEREILKKVVGIFFKNDGKFMNL